jgi:putative ABC transport system ATP-binding protein
MPINHPPAALSTMTGRQGVSLSIKSLGRRFGRASQGAVLESVSLEVAEGEVILLTGPSGCGKTTLLNLLAGLDRPTSGRLLVGRDDVGRMREGDRAVWRAETVGMVFQHHLIPPGQTALDSVALPLVWNQGTSIPGARRIAMWWLDRVGLGDVADERVERLSGGQRQRVAIARALAPNPLLILADEPTAHLDMETGYQITGILREHAQDSGATMIVVSHEHAPEDWGAHRAFTLSAGRLVEG